MALGVLGLSIHLSIASDGEGECPADMNVVTKECEASQDPAEFEGKGAKCGYSKRSGAQFANCPALSPEQCLKEPKVCKLVGSKCTTAFDNPDKCADRTDAQGDKCGKYNTLGSDHQTSMNCLCSKKGNVPCIVNCSTLNEEACRTEPRSCTWNSDNNECIRAAG